MKWDEQEAREVNSAGAQEVISEEVVFEVSFEKVVRFLQDWR